MAKKMEYTPKEDKNLSNKGNSKNFHKGEQPSTYGESDFPDDTPVDIGNEVGGESAPNMDKNKIYEKRMITPREPVLNAVPMPNNKKGKRVDKSILNYTGDEEYAGICTAPAEVPVGGVMRPNNIR